MSLSSLNVEEDGTIELGDSIESLSFHQALNVFLVTTREGRVRVFDPHSCLKLSDVPVHGDGCMRGGVVCVYHGESKSVVVCGGRTVGMRRDHHGVLLLATVLQGPVSAPEETVTVEMLLSEGIQLQHTLAFGEMSNLEHAAEVREVLAQGIAAHQAQSRTNPKLAKWSTLRLELPLGVLRSVCLGLVIELKRVSRYIPALSIASALIQRLGHLLPPPTPDTGQGPPGAGPPDREAMCSEAARLATFIKWPHMNYKWALPEQMAQAGFFHQPIAADDDRAMCFICSVCLVYWEPTDEP